MFLLLHHIYAQERNLRRERYLGITSFFSSLHLFCWSTELATSLEHAVSSRVTWQPDAAEESDRHESAGKTSYSKVLNGSRARHDGTVCKCVHGGSNFIVTEAYQVRNLHLWRRHGLYGHGTYFAAQSCKAAQYATVHGMSLKAFKQLVGSMLLAGGHRRSRLHTK